MLSTRHKSLTAQIAGDKPHKPIFPAFSSASRQSPPVAPKPARYNRPAMANTAQIEANRRNAQRSTGPKTPEGKKISRLNATKHGLLANESTLPQESIPEFEQLLTAFREEHHPATATEEFLVHQMADAQWRLRRIRRVETGMFDALMVEAEEQYQTEITRSTLEDPPDLTPEQKAIRKHDRDTALLGRAFLQRPESVAILSRYENSIRRSFYKALEELRRIRTRPIPPPQDQPYNSCETNPIPPQPVAKQDPECAPAPVETHPRLACLSPWPLAHLPTCPLAHVLHRNFESGR